WPVKSRIGRGCEHAPSVCHRSSSRARSRSMRLVSGWVTLLVAATVGTGLSGCMTTTEINGQPATASQERPQQPTEADARKRAAIRLQLAATYYQKGQFNIAYEEVQRALQLDSSYADAYGLLGLINMDMGKQSEAEGNFQRAL